MKLQELLNDHQLYHSQLQQDYLITLKSGGTLYGQYKQALRELYKRFRGLRETFYDRKKSEIEIKQLRNKIRVEKDVFEKELKQVEYERKIMQREEGERVYTETLREFKRFYQQASALKEKIGELTPENRNRLDKEMWEYRVKEMIALDFVSAGRISSRTYETINSLPKDVKKPILTIIKDQKQHASLIKWYEDKDDDCEIDYDKLPELSYNEDEILKLIN